MQPVQENMKSERQQPFFGHAFLDIACVRSRLVVAVYYHLRPAGSSLLLTLTRQYELNPRQKFLTKTNPDIMADSDNYGPATQFLF